MKRIRFCVIAAIIAVIVAGVLFGYPAQAAPLIQSAPPVYGAVRSNANLRAGPGTNYAVIGSARAAQRLNFAGCNDACDWYQLDSGEWIAAFLVLPLDAPAAATPDTASAPAENAAKSLVVVSWNIESGGADARVVAQRVAAFQDVDLWGFSEVGNAADAEILEAAAEEGESANFESIVSRSGGGDRLVIVYDADRFEILGQDEVEYINIGGTVRAPILIDVRDKESGREFVFMVNHLNRGDDQRRHDQAALLNEWAIVDGRPAIAVGDYNFDWAIVSGDQDHDLGYDWMTAQDVWKWVRPGTLTTTQCSGWPCTYNSVLDFVFTAGDAQNWQATSEIIVTDGEFPDDATTSDHRPVLARFDLVGTSAPVLPPTPGALPPTPTDTPIPTPAAACSQANATANLRAGPSTAYAVAGNLTRGQCVSITGRNADGSWYKLSTGAWVAAFLIAQAPDIGSIPLVDVPTATPTPTQGEVSPTPTPTPTISPSPPGQVAITYIFYDGDEPQVEGDEYAIIKNRGDAAVNLSGWHLNADDPGQDFWFPALELAPGQECHVYTNRNDPNTCGFSFGNDGALWANKGECGHLYDAAGAEVSTYCY